MPELADMIDPVCVIHSPADFSCLAWEERSVYENANPYQDMYRDINIWIGDQIGGAVDWASSGKDNTAVRGALEDIVYNIDAISEGVVRNGYTAIVAEFSGFIISAMAISMILFGIGMLMGWIEYPLKQLGKRLLWWSILLGLIYNWSLFSTLIYELFTEGPLILGGIMVASTGVAFDGGLVGLLDNVLEKGWTAAGKMWEMDGLIIKVLMSVVLWFGTTFLCGYILGLIAISKIGLTIILMMGPLFLIAYMFEFSKHMFQAWLQQVVNYGFITVLTSIVMAFFIRLLDRSFPVLNPDVAVGFSDIVNFMLLFVVMMVVLFQIQGVASGLAGGLQLSTLGAFSASSRMAGNVMRKFKWKK